MNKSLMKRIYFVVLILYSAIGFMRSSMKRCIFLVVDGVNSRLDTVRWGAVKFLQAVGAVLKVLSGGIGGSMFCSTGATIALIHVLSRQRVLCFNI